MDFAAEIRRQFRVKTVIVPTVLGALVICSPVFLDIQETNLYFLITTSPLPILNVTYHVEIRRFTMIIVPNLLS